MKKERKPNVNKTFIGSQEAATRGVILVTF